MLDRGTGISIWRQISESLGQDIRNRLYAPGEKLPPEPELAAKFDVNRHTIRRAMGELEQNGLVRIEQGRGTFVQEHAIDYALGRRVRFSENLRSQGLSGHHELLSSHTLKSAPIAKHLELARTASLTCLRTMGKTDKRALCVAEHYFDSARLPDLAEQYAALQSITKVYAHYGIEDYTRRWSRITAALPSDDIARLLGQPKSRPILQIEYLNVDTEDKPLQYSITRFTGDWVQLVINDPL